MKFGEKVRRLRREMDLTQEEAAKLIGVSRRTFVGYEQDGRYPRNREIYARMAKLFDCDQNYLLTEDEEFVLEASARYGDRGRRQAEELVTELAGLFAGGELSESDRDAVMIALQKAYFDCKADNLKYGRRKSAEPEDED